MVHNTSNNSGLNAASRPGLPGSGSGLLKWTFARLATSTSSVSSGPNIPYSESYGHLSASKSTDSSDSNNELMLIDSYPAGPSGSPVRAAFQTHSRSRSNSHLCVPPIPTSPRAHAPPRPVLRDTSNHNVGPAQTRKRRDSIGAKLRKPEPRETGDENARLLAENAYLRFVSPHSFLPVSF
jgi:hypothetical protein